MKDDIMLLQLETDAKINQYVNVLNLPKGGITDMKSGTRCTVAGWGETKINNYSDTLQEVKVKGDSGGPLICKKMYTGIVSFGA
ncbi:granzyme A-like [Hemitrygon akajei]|uniref:granzyme A-like n=1 Tax=Hemitrygon akajei TaxID=2704970 RepID=UPI003BF98EB7